MAYKDNLQNESRAAQTKIASLYVAEEQANARHVKNL